MKERLKIFSDGLFKDNPVLIQLLGCCSVLAISVTVKGSLGMGAALTFVLVCSNLVISLLRKIIPGQIRIPCFIVVIATFVTLVEMIVEAFTPDLYKALGVFLPLIVVNCIVLGRAEMFASKRGIVDSLLDGIGMGLGYTMVIVAMAVVRELIGNGTLWDVRIIPEGYQIGILSQTPGGFLLFGIAIAVLVKINERKGRAYKPEMGCENCNLNCADGVCRKGGEA